MNILWIKENGTAQVLREKLLKIAIFYFFQRKIKKNLSFCRSKVPI